MKCDLRQITAAYQFHERLMERTYFPRSSDGIIFREFRRITSEDQQMEDHNGYYCVTANSMACERRANCVSSRGSRIFVGLLPTTSCMAGRRNRLLAG